MVASDAVAAALVAALVVAAEDGVVVSFTSSAETSENKLSHIPSCIYFAWSGKKIKIIHDNRPHVKGNTELRCGG